MRKSLMKPMPHIKRSGGRWLVFMPYGGHFEYYSFRSACYRARQYSFAGDTMPLIQAQAQTAREDA